MPLRVVHVIDVESAGYDNDGPADVIEVGVTVLQFEQGVVSIGHPVSWLVRPERPITTMGKSIHNIVDGDVSGAPPLATVMAKVREITPRAEAYAAHHFQTERKMLPDLAGEKWICTLKASRHLNPEAKSHTNGFLRYYLESVDEASARQRAIAMPPHRAGPDSFVTACNLARMAERMSLDAMVEMTMNPKPAETMTVGKHAGKQFSAIPLDYLKWITEPGRSFDDEIEAAAKAEIQRRVSAGEAAAVDLPGVKRERGRQLPLFRQEASPS